jgi:hypothetical protein
MYLEPIIITLMLRLFPTNSVVAARGSYLTQNYLLFRAENASYDNTFLLPVTKIILIGQKCYLKKWISNHNIHVYNNWKHSPSTLWIIISSHALPCLALPSLVFPTLSSTCLALHCLDLSLLCLELPCLSLPFRALPCLVLVVLTYVTVQGKERQGKERSRQCKARQVEEREVKVRLGKAMQGFEIECSARRGREGKTWLGKARQG